MPDTLPIELIQFPLSHFNEKVRWALDYKNLPHTRRNLLPGPHAVQVMLLTGQKLVPVLRLEGHLLHGSAQILDALERYQPEPALLPKDPDLAARALEVQRLFDEEIGPLVRRGVFAGLVTVPSYLGRMFAANRPRLQRILYRASLPLVTGVMTRSMGIRGPESFEEALAGTLRGLDFVAEHAGPGGALVGDAFSVADLSAASLLAPAVSPEGSPMDLPRPHPPVLESWLARWRDHPGAAWVRDQFATQRPPTREIG